MGEFLFGKSSRRRWLGLLGSAGLAYGAGERYLRAFPVTSGSCWGGLAPGSGYSLQAIRLINSHLPFHFAIERQFDQPVINTRVRTPGLCLEGGVATKVGSLYRLFSCQFDHGNWNKPTRLVYLVSRDGIKWKFQAVIKAAATFRGIATPFWEPTPIFDHGKNRWYMFFVEYGGSSSEGGKIRMMASTVVGYDQGISGPWRDIGVIMGPGADSQAWEGVQGVDSFYPYQADGRWYAMYGSSTWSSTNRHPRWCIGLASASSLTGPWNRCEGNPLQVEKVYWENPIVTRIGSWYVAVYDAAAPGSPTYIHNGGHIAGYTCSKDGIHWLPGGRILVQPSGPANWSSDLRTPLGLIHEGRSIYTMFYSGFMHGAGPIFSRYESVGMVKLRLVWNR